MRKWPTRGFPRRRQVQSILKFPLGGFIKILTHNCVINEMNNSIALRLYALGQSRAGITALNLYVLMGQGGGQSL